MIIFYSKSNKNQTNITIFKKFNQKKNNDNYPTEYYQKNGDISNQQPEMTQVVVDEEFDNKVRIKHNKII